MQAVATDLYNLSSDPVEADITKDLPARYRVVIEDYFKALSNSSTPTAAKP